MTETGTAHSINEKLTTTVSKISSVFRTLETIGVANKDILSAAGINSSVLSSPDNTLSAVQVRRLFQEAAELSRNPYFGLHLGRDIRFFSNILAYILMNCSTMKEAITKFIRYQKLVDGLNYLEIQPGKTHVTVVYASYDERCDTDRHLVDYRLSSLRHYTEVLARQPVIPTEARFRYSCPDTASEYQAAFQCKLSFDSTMNALVYPNTLFDIPIPEPNRELLDLFERHADSILIKLNRQESFSQKVSSLILSMIRAEIPTIDDIAAKLAIGKRTLQIHLQKEGTSFSRLISKIRQEMAVHYLMDGSYSISEISYLLGYSEPSVFHRNFKKWTDATPGEYRAGTTIR